jgi:hypothetical protein
MELSVLAVGCLIPIVLIIAGAVAGTAIGGQHDAIIAAVAGGVIGIAAMIALLWGWERIRSHRL